MELKKAQESDPNKTVGTKRENSEANNCTTNSHLVYVRRKIDHEQQSKLSPSNEILKICEGVNEKVPISSNEILENREVVKEKVPISSDEILKNCEGVKEKVPISSDEILKNCEGVKEKVPISEPDLDLECHETNLDSDLCELKVIAPSGVKNKDRDSNLGKNELKSLTENTNDTKLDFDSRVLKVGGTHLRLIESENDEMQSVTSNQVNKDINEPKLGSNLSESTVVSSNQFTNIDQDDSNLGLIGKRNEPRYDTEPKLESQLHELNTGEANLAPNQEKCESNLAPNPITCNLDWRERYVKLQMFLKDCDRSSQEDYILMLRSLSAFGRSKHALDLEKRAMNLLMEEGKELRRMSYLNVLGREWPKENIHK